MPSANNDSNYWEMVSQFIEQANAHTEERTPGEVASALLNAAARYSAFYLAGSSESRKDLKEDKDVLVQDVSREFKKRFAEELEDYIENYKVYFEHEEASE
tara:strand:- start:368 stop:670 length:303 start_codon:yes stop_codon:yes gene_type:complete